MKQQPIHISPATKVADLLEAYPELEEVLYGISPAFKKLQNPILRKTVAKVATLQQISVVGDVSIESLITQLRNAVGQHDAPIVSSTQQPVVPKPDWLIESRITLVFDAMPIIDGGGSPLKDILAQSNSLATGEILELHTAFVPEPIIDMLINKGFSVYTEKNTNLVKTFISR